MENYVDNDDLVNDADVDEDESSYPIENFRLTTTPNDFNISTIISFLDAGVFKIPDFQRNYVWDINKASRLIESFLIGLPIPQMFLYEKARNEFYVIDGQQRLMSIYFFVKGRFPKPNTRILLKQNAEEKSFISKSFLENDQYFSNFSLKLDSSNNPYKNKFHDLNYYTLGDDKTTLELTTIRNMVIKPILEDEINAQAMFEIFNRLNSGGMNLNYQEIRMSLYNSDYIKTLKELNNNKIWRSLLNKDNPDLRLRDVENILRIHGMLFYGLSLYRSDFFRDLNIDNSKFEYQNSMVGFLNSFANLGKKFSSELIQRLANIWEAFMQKCANLMDVNFNFSSENNSKISITFFEAMFYAVCREAFVENNPDLIHIPSNFISDLKQSQEFRDASMGKTSAKANVQKRLEVAYELFQQYNNSTHQG